mmetsp:Transcript_19881/g.43187  ORF Transcript_19881/g.43187 Transcript_19881/m.43187 type:complete len:308 (+) Transcript_19881:161-1084(+)
MSLLPVTLLFAIGVSRVYFAGHFRTRENALIALSAREWGDAIVALLLSHRFVLPVPSIVPYWDFLTRKLSRLVDQIAGQQQESSHSSSVATAATDPKSFSVVVRESILNGPLGAGASKVVDVVVGIFLWRLLKKEWPAMQIFGKQYPGVFEWSILVGVSVAVNFVLYAWSKIAKTRGNHEGVNRMVASSRDKKSLTPREHLLYGGLAFVNATCEEVSFRYFWRTEFAVYLSDRHANLAQAAIFGILHYYGIPSGLAGVGLTFVYGWIMGLLMNHVGGGGLFLPIATHTIADYYLFSSIARRKITGKK